MQGLDPEGHDPPHNPSNEGTINEDISSEIGSVAPLSDQLEGVVETIEEGNFLPPINPPLTGPFHSPVIELPSTRYIDSFSSYHLPLDTFSRKYLGMDPIPLDFQRDWWYHPLCLHLLVVDPAIATFPQTLLLVLLLCGEHH
jgi:hypothetical protein